MHYPTAEGHPVPLKMNSRLEQLARQIVIDLTIMNNREQYANEPLRADEITIAVSRDYLRTLLEHALNDIRRQQHD